MSSIGRIDVHCHLLPGVDDGCRSVLESIQCARRLVENGYTHCFCTPHIWPSLPANGVDSIPRAVAALQAELDRAEVPLRLLPGGELNFRPNFTHVPMHEIVTFGMHQKFVLADFWADRLPPFFDECVKWLQSQGLTVILAHPERVRAVQDSPELVDHFAELGIRLQGNLQCLGDPPTAPTRRLAERYLREGRYFLLGSDTHGPEGLTIRMQGLARAIEIAGEEEVWKLTSTNPASLVSALP